MKIAIVGPVHPYKGGIPQHTTALAHHLRDAGHEVKLVNWKHQYPFFYPGQQFVPGDKPELPVFEGTKRVLSWRNPAGWVAEARKLRDFDEVIFVWFVPTIQGPVVLSMMKALGKKGPKKIILCHNIVSHSASGPDIRLSKLAFARADELLVHTEALATQARKLTKTPVTVAAMPAHLPNQPSRGDVAGKLHQRLLFFGLVRKYKGVDVLIKALARVPDIKLTVAGEMWGKQKASLDALIADLKLGDRVKLQPEYVPADQLNDLFASADGSVLPYRAGTATQNVTLAFAHGLPVIATKVGSIPEQVRDGVDGLLCEPDDVDSLAAALQHFYEPGVAATLRARIPKVSDAADWQAYVDALTRR